MFISLLLYKHTIPILTFTCYTHTYPPVRALTLANACLFDSFRYNRCRHAINAPSSDTTDDVLSTTLGLLHIIAYDYLIQWIATGVRCSTGRVSSLLSNLGGSHFSQATYRGGATGIRRTTKRYKAIRSLSIAYEAMDSGDQ